MGIRRLGWSVFSFSFCLLSSLCLCASVVNPVNRRTTMEPPQYPAGPDTPVENPTPERRSEWIAEIARAPALLRQAVAGLTDAQLDTRYKNWTVRQIVHHLADSHVNAYVRFKLA